jgi:GntR family transcriptional regulator/MocR family aminotransferase
VLQALAPDRVVLIGSASKTLAPALRLGWLLAPETLAEAIAEERWFADSGGPVVDALALGSMIERGELERHLRRTRVGYLVRRRELVDALTAIGLGRWTEGRAAGLHLCVQLPEDVDDVAVARGLQEQRINVRPLSDYRFVHSGRPGLVIGYGRLHETAVPMIAAALRPHVSA